MINPVYSQPDDEAPKVVDSETSIRDWLFDLLPDIDGPALHALTMEFENEAIVKYGDILECIDSGVLEMSDIKEYMKSAKLPKLKSSKILEEFQKIISAKK